MDKPAYIRAMGSAIFCASLGVTDTFPATERDDTRTGRTLLTRIEQVEGYCAEARKALKA